MFRPFLLILLVIHLPSVFSLRAIFPLPELETNTSIFFSNFLEAIESRNETKISDFFSDGYFRRDNCKFSNTLPAKQAKNHDIKYLANLRRSYKVSLKRRIVYYTAAAAKCSIVDTTLQLPGMEWKRFMVCPGFHDNLHILTLNSRMIDDVCGTM